MSRRATFSCAFAVLCCLGYGRPIVSAKLGAGAKANVFLKGIGNNVTGRRVEGASTAAMVEVSRSSHV
jgi:hypothetical protein